MSDFRPGTVAERPCGRKPITWSIPVSATAAMAASRRGGTSAIPSMCPSSAEYIRATPRAVMVPSDGMSEVSTSERLACSASGTTPRGMARSSGDPGSGRSGAGPADATCRATRGKSGCGTPKWTSSSMPRGPVTTSLRSVEIVRPVARRMISPSRKPKVSRGAQSECRVPTRAPRRRVPRTCGPSRRGRPPSCPVEDRGHRRYGAARAAASPCLCRAIRTPAPRRRPSCRNQARSTSTCATEVATPFAVDAA